MTEESSKIIDFQAKKKQAEDMTQEEFIQSQFPPEVTNKLNEMDAHVVELAARINDALIAFSDENGKQMDISIPLEALAQAMGTMASELDIQVLPEVIQAHYTMRSEILQNINQTVIKFTEQKDMPVYSQDLYIGLTLTLLSYIKQHRLFSLLKESSQPKE